MNECHFIGNLTRDVEHSVLQNGMSVAKFTLAVNRTFKNTAGEYEADYPIIVAWRELADRCAKYLSKGKKVAVTCEFRTRIYEDKGTKHYMSEFVARQVEFLSTKSETQSETQENTAQVSEMEEIDDDDMPF